MTTRFALLAAALLATLPATARAQTTLEKVRAQNYLQCGSVARPGLAEDDGKGDWKGLEVEMCRAIAIAVLGKDARFAYHGYGSDKDFDGVRAGADQVSFLTFSEMAEQKLTDKVLPGPTIFLMTHSIMVAESSKMRRPADLAGETVCSLAGTPANTSLDATVAEDAISISRYAFSEDGEMFDAFRVQKCQAIAAEITALAEARLDGGVNHLAMRILDAPLKSFPIVAATPLAEDAQFAAIVAWTVHSLLAADRHETINRADGLRAMHVDGKGLGLAETWQKDVVATVGRYDQIWARTLGAGSALKLSRGPADATMIAPTTD